MPSKVCNQPGCDCKISMKERYCDDHRREVVKQSNRAYDSSKRNQTHNRFYHCADWKAKRDEVMKKHGGLCSRCVRRDMVTNADVVDHKSSYPLCSGS